MQVVSPASLAAQAQAELITQPLYAGRTVASAAASTVFFDGTNAADRRLTNVDQNGQLSHPKFFRIGGFRLVIDMITSSGTLADPTGHVDDHINLMYDGFYEFKIGDLKPYLTVPNYFIPGGLGAYISGFSGETLASNQWSYAVSNGYPVFGNYLRIKHWISIPPLQQFQGKITWSSLTLGATTTMTNFLDGEFGREVL